MVKGVLPNKFGLGARFGFRGDVLGTAKRMMDCTAGYSEAHPAYATGAFVAAYVSLQTFAIPGPIVLSVLAGALYPYWLANLLVAACATTGASLCFLLSRVLGRGLALRSFPERIKWFRKKVKDNRKRGNLIYYMFFLRFTPFLPNWFVNIASPLASVPFTYFFVATLFGQAPANMIHTSTGLTLSKISDNLDRAASPGQLFLVLFVLQFVALLPTLFKRRLADRL
jgi:uncharacterized membrane protein YdjX (TVP38/TMEM64 family)